MRPNRDSARGGHGRQTSQMCLIMISMICFISYLITITICTILGYRRHELTLAIKGDARNFFERQLFKDIY